MGLHGVTEISHGFYLFVNNWSVVDADQSRCSLSIVALFLSSDISLFKSIIMFFFFGLFVFSRAAPEAYGGSQARG